MTEKHNDFIFSSQKKSISLLFSNFKPHILVLVVKQGQLKSPHHSSAFIRKALALVKTVFLTSMLSKVLLEFSGVVQYSFFKVLPESLWALFWVKRLSQIMESFPDCPCRALQKDWFYLKLNIRHFIEYSSRFIKGKTISDPVLSQQFTKWSTYLFRHLYDTNFLLENYKKYFLWEINENSRLVCRCWD